MLHAKPTGRAEGLILLWGASRDRGRGYHLQGRLPSGVDAAVPANNIDVASQARSMICPSLIRFQFRFPFWDVFIQVQTLNLSDRIPVPNSPSRRSRSRQDPSMVLCGFCGL